MDSKETKDRIMISLEPEAVEWIDAVGVRFHMTRSQVINKCVLDTRETLRQLDKVGMKPERLAKVADWLISMWQPPLGLEPKAKHV